MKQREKSLNWIHGDLRKFHYTLGPRCPLILPLMVWHQARHLHLTETDKGCEARIKVGWTEERWGIVILVTSDGRQSPFTAVMSTSSWSTPLHKDLVKTRMKREAETIGIALKWNEQSLLSRQAVVCVLLNKIQTMSQSTLIERAAEVGRVM